MSLKKLIIADDHPVSRSGLVAVIRLEWPQVEIFEASNGVELVNMYKTLRPDLIIVDYQMPQKNGLEASIEILRKNPDAKVMLLTLYDSIPVALNFLKHGGKAFISKGSDIDHILNGIKAVMEGKHYFSSKHKVEIQQLLEVGIKKNVPTLSLSPREFQLVMKLCLGMTNREIAEKMSLSARTIESYRKNLLKKVQVKNTAELIEYIIRNGIL